MSIKTIMASQEFVLFAAPKRMEIQIT